MQIQRWLVPSLLLALPLSAQQIYIYPQTSTIARGGVQTVTAIVNGYNDKTVTWVTDGGASILGTNPCVVNEPCTVGLKDATPGTYHLTATSNADGSLVATAVVTFTDSPTPATDHPRFLVNSSMLPALRAKSISSNPMYQALLAIANSSYTNDASVWSYSTWNGSECAGGSGPISDQSANWKEGDAWQLAQISVLASDAATRNQYGCASRDIFMTNIRYVLNGELDLSQGNRWSDSAVPFALTADWLMGGNYLSASDIVTVRAYLAKLELLSIENIYNGSQALIGSYNSPAQFQEANENSTTGMLAMGNNYTQSRILMMSTMALTFNDNTTDDPPLTNTCSATRYQVCPDGTAGSLHAYWRYVDGGLLYKSWANMENGSVVRQAYNSAYSNLPSQPMCNTLWHAAIPCLGGGRGGEANEGYGYGSSIARLRLAMNALHTSGNDDPILYGPQISIGTTSYWDLRYVSDYTQLVGLSGLSSERSRWAFLTNGDTLYYFTYPSTLWAESATLAFDGSTGRTDRSDNLSWLIMNTAFGTADGSAGNCKSYCGFVPELSNDYASSTALDMFIALPATNPVTTNPPADPRSTLPTDWFDAGNNHIVARDGKWGNNTGTVFSYYCTDTQIDHEHQYCGGFSVFSGGEYITKPRTEFNDYNNRMSIASNQNVPALVNTPAQTGCTLPGCYFADSTTYGGQLWHGYQAGLNTLRHAELPGYVATVADSTNSYNGGWGGFGQLNGITSASRSLVYLRGSHEVVYYDRGTSTGAWNKSLTLTTTGPITVTNHSASWPTRSSAQVANLSMLLPASGTFSALPLTVTTTTSAPYSQLTNGATMQMTCTSRNGDGTASDITHSASWSSSTPAIATVSATGLVTAVAIGSTSISCSTENISSHGSLTVISDASTGSWASDGDPDQQGDWEPAARLKMDAGNVTSARFLSVLQWAPTGDNPATSALVQSTSGQNFDGALVGSSLVMFLRDWPATFTDVTYPASGATTEYVSDLTPNTIYAISGDGSPASASTDNAGVLVFTSAGTGNITIGAPTVAPASVFSGVRFSNGTIY